MSLLTALQVGDAFGSAFPMFDAIETYFFLLDDELKTTIQGQPFVCLNPEHDMWMHLRSVPLGQLKSMAVQCVARRQLEMKKPLRSFQEHGSNDE